MKNKVLFAIVFAFIFCMFFTVTSSAEPIIDSKPCGPDATCTLDEDGTLTICGEGMIYSSNGLSSVPWKDKKDLIKNVIISKDIRGIWHDAFVGCKNIEGVYISDLSSWCNMEFSTFYSNPLSNRANLYLNGELIIDLVIPEDVTVIKDYAFEGALSLNSVYIHGNVKQVGNYAFTNCINIKNVTFSEGVEVIGEYAFASCRNLTNILLPESLTTIGFSAFGYCLRLTSINIPKNVVHIGSYAFEACDRLKSIVIPQTVTSMGGCIFLSCDDITVYVVAGSCAEENCKDYKVNYQTLSSISGEIDGLEWRLYDSILEISGNGDIPDYSKTDNAPWYEYRSEITSIVILDGVNSIGDYAFYNLSNATSIEIADSVKSIGTQFIRGTKIAQITLPAVERIKNQAFARADSLTTLIAGESIRDIYGTIFYSENVTVKAPKDSYIGKYAESFAELFTVDATVVFESTGDAVRPVNYFGKCGENCFYAVYQNSATSWAYEISGSGKMKNFPYVSDKNIALGYTFTPTYYMEGNERNILSAKVYDGVTTLGNYTFFKCTKMTDIELHNGITSIGRGAFQACARLEAITVPDAVTRIERTAFNGCTALTDVYIPEGVTVFEDSVFAKCNTEGLSVHTESQTVIDVISKEYPEIMLDTGYYNLALLLYTQPQSEPFYNPETKRMETKWPAVLIINGKEVAVALKSIDGEIYTDKYLFSDKNGDGTPDLNYTLVNYTVDEKTGKYILCTTAESVGTTEIVPAGAVIRPTEEAGFYEMIYTGNKITFTLDGVSVMYYTFLNSEDEYDRYLYFGEYTSDDMPESFAPKTTSQITYLVKGTNNVYTLRAGVVSGEFEPALEEASATFVNDARLIKYCAEGSTAEAIDGVGYYTYLFLDFTTMKNGVQTIDATLSIENGATKAVEGYFYGWDYATKKYVRVTTDNTDAVQTGTLTAVDATRRIVYIDGVSFTVGNKTFDFSQGFKLPEKVNIFSTAKNNLYEYKNFDTSSLAALLEIANENGKTLDVAVGAYPLDDGSLGIAWIMVDNYYYVASGESEILTQTFDIVSRISGTAK